MKPNEFKPYTFVFHFDKYPSFDVYFLPYVFGVQNNDEYTDDEYMNPTECTYVRSFFGEYGLAHEEVCKSHHTYTFHCGVDGTDVEEVRSKSIKAIEKGLYARYKDAEEKARERVKGAPTHAFTAIRIVAKEDVGEEEYARVVGLARKFVEEFIPTYSGTKYHAPLRLLEVEYRPTTLEDLW